MMSIHVPISNNGCCATWSVMKHHQLTYWYWDCYVILAVDGRLMIWKKPQECKEVHHVFFHKFIEYGSVELFAKHVILPQSNEDALCPEYDAAGLAGCIGSMDVTHIMCERVFQYMRQSHIGFKMSQTARTYNLIVNHARRILSTSHGHPSSWNDKTLVLFDDFASSLHEGSILNDFSFKLLEQSVDGTVIEGPYKGAWLLVDNGS